MNQRTSKEQRERDPRRGEPMRDYDHGAAGPHYRPRDERDWHEGTTRGEFRRRYSGGGEYLRDTPSHRAGWPDVNYEYEHGGDYADEVVGGDYTSSSRSRDPDFYERRRDEEAARHAAARYRPREHDLDRLESGWHEGYARHAAAAPAPAGEHYRPREHDLDRLESGWHEGSGYRETTMGGNRGKGPRNYVRADERIHEDVCERLTQDDTIDASDIDVDVQNGIVTLNGSVRERWIKHRAEDIADACSGVKDVVNQLRVEHGSAGADSTLT